MNKLIKSIIVVGGLACMTGTAIAEDAAPDEAIKYRKQSMQLVGAHTTSFFAILQGKVPHQGDLAYHANGLAEASARSAAAFEQNTAGQGEEKTTAKASIWEGPEFAAGMDALAKATADLAAAVEANDMAAIGTAAGAVGASCKGCHDKFREKHDH